MFALNNALYRNIMSIYNRLKVIENVMLILKSILRHQFFVHIKFIDIIRL